MSILTRQNLQDRSYRRHLALPEHLSWTDEQLDQSLASLWAQRPAGPVWVFAYGSLIWNPMMPFEEQCNATLTGWQRSFCLRSISGRGSPQQPGRVLSLLPGHEVQGVALRLAEAQAYAELRLLWTREMTGGNYHPQWVRCERADGSPLTGLTFVANSAHAQHESDACPATVARLVATASGVFGPNIDYLTRLDEAMRQRGLRDPYIDAIMDLLRA